MLYQKIPEIVSAHQFDGSYTRMKELQDVFPDLVTQSASYHSGRNTVSHWHIKTNVGNGDISAGDFIIRNGNGVFFIVDQETFHSIYEPAKLD